ncbi:hypothetical protein RRG08_038084 [Elysia crispata]|uniref:Uncharacterized protein n=1 Tax=Elysia crispata TaxID=231223 RepID=A0AAE0ZZL8_9GAST|nr:hypothetical protein RRG08_038084 [Elysia crispata]
MNWEHDRQKAIGVSCYTKGSWCEEPCRAGGRGEHGTWIMGPSGLRDQLLVGVGCRKGVYLHGEDRGVLNTWVGCITWGYRQRGVTYDLSVFSEECPVLQCRPTKSVDPNHVLIKLVHLNNDASLVPSDWLRSSLVLNTDSHQHSAVAVGEKQQMRACDWFPVRSQGCKLRTTTDVNSSHMPQVTKMRRSAV